ncbi:MAG TPA: hypothetical protein VGX78_03930 [Pirellulales bacterium]|nr:hypothetical protein [Pirellulales bacterium]
MLLTNKTETALAPAGTSAANVVRLARLRLAASTYPALRRLDCCFHEGVFTVRGRVSTFHERQMAWIVLCDLAGVEEFVDRVEVAGRALGQEPDSKRPAYVIRRAK